MIFLPKAVWKIIFLSGARFGKIFGSELLFFCLCVQLVFFDVVLPMFLLYYLALFSQKLPEEIFSFGGAHSAETFLERTLVFGLCVWLVFFFGIILPVFLLYYAELLNLKEEALSVFTSFFCSETFRFFPKFAPKIFFVAIVGQKVFECELCFRLSGSWIVF